MSLEEELRVTRCVAAVEAGLAINPDGIINQTEGGVIWNDPDLAIDWPVPPDQAVLSDKDLVLPRLADLPPLSF